MNLLDRFLLAATVGQIEPVTPRMRRIRLTGPSVRGLAWLPGQHVRVRVDATRLRSYSVFDHVDGEHLDLCVLDHPSAGPGTRWARRVRVGQPVALTRPQGRLVPRPGVPYHLFVGDETASVAFAAMLRALSADARVHGVIEVRGPDDRVPLHRAGELTWIHRDRPDGIIQALRALDLPAAPGVAYVAGEARACQAARRHLRAERGWPADAVVVKPFWTPGRRGLD